MAGRIRYFRPELLDDEVMQTLSSDAWRIAVSLVLLADDFGNVRFSDKYVGANVFQDTSRDVRAASDELVRAGIVTTYSSEGQQYAAIRGWTEEGRFRQRLDNASKRSRVPGPEKDDRTNIRALGAEPAETRGDSVPPLEGTGQSRGSRARAPIPTPITDPDHRPPTTGTEAAADAAAGADAPPAAALELKLEEPKAKKGGAAEKIFAAYKDARVRFNPKTKVDMLVLTPKARKDIAARLSEGHQEKTLVLAAIGIFQDPWEGRENHIELRIAMRSENIVKFAELAQNDPTIKWARLRPPEPQLEDQGPPAEPPADFAEKLAKWRAQSMNPLLAAVAEADKVGAPVFCKFKAAPLANTDSNPNTADLNRILGEAFGEEPQEAANGAR